jgi:hypothetical protein
MLMGDNLEFQCSANASQEIMEACLCPQLNVVDKMANHRCLLQQHIVEGTFAKRKTWGLTFVDVIIVKVVEVV